MPPIDKMLRAFEQGDLEKLDSLVCGDLDLRIDHYRDDEADVDWQHSSDRAGFHTLLGRLASDVFPKGTKILGLETQELGDGWTLSKFTQQFYYQVRQREVHSQTWILAHQSDGRVDYFRETVGPVVNI